ncbi:MAG TPA: sigma-70 family RNA polymerase sigma factor [Dehalococcoidia bacterium]|nr:sigma-70 family RNA polymerase sigma factor [Dehalococcoidia bacterium]
MTDNAARSHEEEGQLIEQAKAGAPEAWTEIYQRHYRPLYRYALARVGEPALAEDLTAAVFLEALHGINSYSYRGRPLLAWLYRIARNVVTDHRRRESGRRQGAVRQLQSKVLWYFMRSGSEREAEAIPSLQDPATEEQRAERLDLKQALARLGGLQREVIALHYFAGFSLREVARLLGKNERAVYSLQARALAALRRHLAG